MTANRPEDERIDKFTLSPHDCLYCRDTGVVVNMTLDGVKPCPMCSKIDD